MHNLSRSQNQLARLNGQFYAWEFTHKDSTTFQIFLEQANINLKLERKRNILICDNETWYKKKTLVFGKFTPKPLPPYSSDLDPIERLLLLMKA
jgi:transposase